MKKILSLAIALIMCVAVFASCAGKSAYDIAVENGFEGTVEEWLESLKGENGKDGKDGQNGSDGKDGQPGQNGTNGTNGVDGTNGTNGTDGADGQDGKDGKDGLVPKLQINPETLMWEVSYDEGKTWNSTNQLCYVPISITEDGFWKIGDVVTTFKATYDPANPDVDVDISIDTLELVKGDFTVWAGAKAPALQLKCTLTNGRVAVLDLTEKMVTKGEFADFTKAGAYTFSVFYLGKTQEVTVNVTTVELISNKQYIKETADAECELQLKVTAPDGTESTVDVIPEENIVGTIDFNKAADYNVNLVYNGASQATTIRVLGLPVATLEEFKNMKADGAYALVADIVLDATIATEFKGLLDGDGHKITVTGAVFKAVNATIKNLVIEGTVARDDAGHLGALAIDANGGTYVNIVNNAAITGDPSSKYWTGGIIGQTKDGETITLIDCVNNGDITGSVVGGMVGKALGSIAATGCKNTGDLTTTYINGGIVGWLQREGSFTNCVNEGDLTTTGTSNGGTGGFIGYTSNAKLDITFEGCTNDGDITAGMDAAGFIGRSGGTKVMTFIDCVNNGNIKSTGGQQAAGFAAEAVGNYKFYDCVNNGNVNSSAHVGGFVAYLTGDGEFEGCTNNGNIEAGANRAGGLVAVIKNKTETVFRNCHNTGEVKCVREDKGDASAGGILAWTYSYASFYDCTNSGDITSSWRDAAGICAEVADTSSAAKQYGVTGEMHIHNCINTGNITGSRGTAGIIGYVKVDNDDNGSGKVTSSLDIQGCKNTGVIVGGTNKVDGDSGHAGGIVGWSEGKVSLKTSTNEGDISTKYQCAGGILAYSAKAVTIEECTNLANVTGQDMAGGISGKINNNYTIIDCVNGSADEEILVTAMNRAGGIHAYATSKEYTGVIKGCVNYGAVESGDISRGNALGHAGGILAMASAKNIITIENCVNYGKITSTQVENQCGNAGGILGKSESAVAVQINGCTNEGAIETKSTKAENDGFAGGIVGSCSASTPVVVSCVNKGTIKAAQEGHASDLVGNPVQ